MYTCRVRNNPHLLPVSVAEAVVLSRVVKMAGLSSGRLYRVTCEREASCMYVQPSVEAGRLQHALNGDTNVLQCSVLMS